MTLAMPAYLLALMATAFAATGGRDQLLMAQLSARLGRRGSLLVSGAGAALVTSGIMAAAGGWIGPWLSSPVRLALLALALLSAAVMLLRPVCLKAAVEPTQSLFAIGLVLVLRQFGDAPRLLVLAIAATDDAPFEVGIGGAIGGTLALALGWILGDAANERLPWWALRMALAAVFAGAAIHAGMAARLAFA